MRTLGRINRATYWLAVALVFVAGIAVQFAAHPQFNATGLLLLLAAAPRLHDIGRPAWWAVAVVVLELVAGMAIGKFLPPQQMMTGISVVAVVVLALIVLLGSLRGDAAANRFGPPPARGISYSEPDRPAA